MWIKLRLKSELALAVAFGLVAIGCGSDSTRPELGTVSGTVTLNGTPLKGVEISFIPTVGRPSDGRTDEDGEYELDYIRDIKGAKVGKHTILVRSGKVDNAKMEPVEVKRGANVIDIVCLPKAQQPDQAANADDAAAAE